MKLLKLLSLTLILTSCENGMSTPNDLYHHEGHTYIQTWSHDPSCYKCKEY